MTEKPEISSPTRTVVMSGADSAWLRMEQDSNQMVITGMLKLNPAPDPDQFRDLLRKRLLKYDRFSQRVINRAAIPIWESAAVDLEYHVKTVSLDDHPTVSTVREYVSLIMSQPLDFTRPLWEMHLVAVNGECTLVAKLHHCIADGIALVRILLALATTSPNGPWFQPHLEYQPKKHSKNNGQSTAFSNISNAAGRIARALYKFVMMPSDTRTSVKGKLQRQKIAAWSDSIPLEEVKKLAELHRVTINDLLLWITCGAIRNYLIDIGEEPGKNDTFGITIPVNLRDDKDSDPTGNRFGLIFLKLPVGESDTTQQLRVIREEMNYIKASGEAIVAFGVLRLLGRMPLVVERLAISFLSSKCSAVVTNVPGPRRKLYLAGSEMEDIMFWVPKSGQLGLGISLISYAGTVRIGVASDAERLHKPGALAQHFYNTYHKRQKKALNLQS